MRDRMMHAATLLIAGLLVNVGCRPAAPVPTTEPEATVELERPFPAEMSPRDAALSAEIIPADPAAALDRIIAQTAEGDLAALWLDLPPAFQSEGNLQFRTLVRSADDEVWRQTRATLVRLVTIFKDREADVFASPLIREEQRTLAESWRGLWGPTLEAAAEVLRSEALDLLTLRESTVTQTLHRLAEPVRPLWKSAVRSAGENSAYTLGGLKSRTVTRDEERATVEVAGPDGPVARTSMIRLEGRWTPQWIVESWPDGVDAIQAFRRRLASPEWADLREPYLKALLELNHRLDELEEARDQPAFNSALAGVIQKGGAIGQLLGATWDIPEPPAGPFQSVQVRVSRELSEAETQALLQHLESLTGDPRRAEYVASSNRGQTVIDIGPVVDVEAFAKGITAATITNVDPAKRQIDLVMKEDGTSPEAP